jgi:hypothetical protein
MTTIGFFGDSFCSDRKDPSNSVKTYIETVCELLNVTCTHSGHGGSSVWDLYLKQFLPKLKTNSLPDICVMVWTEPYRLYHHSVRNMTYSTVEQNQNKTALWRAAYQYYQLLMDHDKTLWEYRMLMDYFDRRIAQQCPKTKFIHMWSFGYSDNWSDETFRNNNVEYLHDWRMGVEIQPAMATVALQGGVTMQQMGGQCANHLVDQDKHNIVARAIVDAVTNYRWGRKIDMLPGLPEMGGILAEHARMGSADQKK